MKKIMFNDKYGLTRAVLEGRKTQTRRLVPLRTFDISLAHAKDKSKAAIMESIKNNSTYKVGDEVAVAQCYGNCGTWFFPVAEYGHMAGYTNKMFVRAEEMPHRIRITNIRVERLQDISEEDCLNEGIYVDDNAPEGVPLDKYIAYSYDADTSHQKRKWWFGTPREAFAVLIDKTCGKGTWKSNPYVFVYDFELIR